MTDLCVCVCVCFTCKVHCHSFSIDFFCRLITLLTWVSDMLIMAVGECGKTEYGVKSQLMKRGIRTGFGHSLEGDRSLTQPPFLFC
jgi:hypothetical protein